MELVKNSYIYWEFIRNLRNLDGVRQGFIEQKIISRNDHEAYMKKNSDFFYICLDNGIPIGYIGVIDGDGFRTATHPDHQGKGAGTFMTIEASKLHPDAFAKVKINNKASIRMMEKSGFKKKYYIMVKE